MTPLCTALQVAGLQYAALARMWAEHHGRHAVIHISNACDPEVFERWEKSTLEAAHWARVYLQVMEDVRRAGR